MSWLTIANLPIELAQVEDLTAKSICGGTARRASSPPPSATYSNSYSTALANVAVVNNNVYQFGGSADSKFTISPIPGQSSASTNIQVTGLKKTPLPRH
jgi:hypothetical protein